MTTPDRYLISFSTIDFTKFPISLGSPSLFIGNDFSYSSIFSTNSLVLSVLIGPGAMLIQLIFFPANSLLNNLKTLVKADLYALEITNFGFGSLITLEVIRKIYPPSLIFKFL